VATILGLEIRYPAPIFGAPPPNFRHDTATDGADQRRVVALSLTKRTFCFFTVLLTAVIARQLTSDPWTPVVAGAVVAGVPKFLFISGVVNNDNLTNRSGHLHLACRRRSASHAAVS
jgi:hypothetical protein